MANYDAKTKDDKCIFCEIAKGNMPVASFWEDYEGFISSAGGTRIDDSRLKELAEKIKKSIQP